ncbi:LuxR family transcriptional regulator [Nocardioides salsibiostraticola]
MDVRPHPGDSAFVGRADEFAAVSRVLDRAAGGTAAALVISGDAGVGKSALMDRACSHADPSALVLAGACLPLSAMTVPFLALRSALRSVHSVLEPPAWLGELGETPSAVPVAFDDWLTGLSRQRLVILTIDDLHWADQSSLDVLMYVLAGPADRQLAVLATVRSSEVSERHPLQRWLADVRRLPRFGSLDLGALDGIAAAEQMSGLMGTAPHQSLVDDVFGRTRGNAYLTRLLVKGLAPHARKLPDDLPEDLTSAVLATYWTLPDQARLLTRILAAGGQPLTSGELTDVTGLAHLAETAEASLLEAAETAVLDVARNGTFWFHHPLFAEVLEANLTDDERIRWHTAFAVGAERQLSNGSALTPELMIAATDHHHRAGRPAEAYHWALRAAECSTGTAEELRLLQRAVELWPRVPEAQETERELLQRMRTAAAKAGSYREDLRAVDRLLDVVDPGKEPLLLAELMLRRADLQFLTGRDFTSENDIRSAVRLSADADPDSWQHACALSQLAEMAAWSGDPDAEMLSDQALCVARASGSSMALSRALTAKASAVCVSGKTGESLHFAQEAVSAAIEAQDFYAFILGTFEELNGLPSCSVREEASHVRSRREQLVSMGAPRAYSSALSAIEAAAWLTVGDWRACQQRLRDVLGSDPGPFADVHARLAAAQLAAWQGRTAEAEGHLARADELFAEGSMYLPFTFDMTRATVALAAGDGERALNAALAGASSSGVPPDRCEWLMPLAAQALATLIESERDAGGDARDLIVRLNMLRARFPLVILDTGLNASSEGAPRIIALNDLYTAEVGRALGDSDNGNQWLSTTDSCHVAELVWEEAYACWRAAEALLAHERHRRVEAASVLRRGLELATDLGAEPMRTELEALAAIARIGVEQVSEVSGELRELPGLTRREREILGHIVVGRTYREIATALFISEKTVSSHVSNLLRKTGTDNRIDLSRLARSVAQADGPTHG